MIRLWRTEKTGVGKGNGRTRDEEGKREGKRYGSERREGSRDRGNEVRQH
jgi:hypothetical protein